MLFFSFTKECEHSAEGDFSGLFSHISKSFRSKSRHTQCCGSGSGAFLAPGSGIRNRFFPEPGSRIPNPYIWEHVENLFGKNFNNSLKIGPNFFLQHFINKIISNLVKLVTTKKSMITNFFKPLSFVAVFGSGIRDPGLVKIRIRFKLPVSATLATPQNKRLIAISYRHV